MESIGSRREAQARAEWIRTFRAELHALEKAGVLQLTDEQKLRIRTHHDSMLASLSQAFDIDATEAQKKLSWGMRIASTLGAFAFCAALYLFFQRFWGVFPVSVQVGVLIAAPLFSLIAAQTVFKRERTPYYTFLLTTISAAAFVVNLSMLGEMFGLTPSPAALLVWGAYGLAAAYHFRMRLLLAAALGCLVCYAAGACTAWFGFDWITFGERPENFILAGLALLTLARWMPHPRDADFQWVYRVLGLAALFVPMIVLAEWPDGTYLPLEGRTVEYLYQILGLLSSAACIWLGIRARFPAGVNISAAVFSVLLLFKMVDWWWDWMPRYLFFLLIGCIGVVLVAMLQRFRSRFSKAEGI
jgi:uncharacterized membrane protein